MKKAPKRELKLHWSNGMCMCVCVLKGRGLGACVCTGVRVICTHACPSFAGFYRMNIFVATSPGLREGRTCQGLVPPWFSFSYVSSVKDFARQRE